MKPTRLETTLIATTICAFTALSSPANSASWVTVNPDGSVTRTEVKSPYHDPKIEDEKPLDGTPTSPIPTAQLPNTAADMATYQGRRQDKRPGVPNNAITLHNGTYHNCVPTCYHPGTYGSPYAAPQPYPAYPSHPAYPGYAQPGGYYGTYTTTTPGPAYSVPLPGTNGGWITSIPLGGTTTTYVPGYPTYGYPAYAPPCPPAPIYGHPAYGHPTYGHPNYGHPTYPRHRGHHTGTRAHGHVSISRGGVNVTIGGSRSTSPLAYSSPSPLGYNSTQNPTIFRR